MTDENSSRFTISSRFEFGIAFRGYLFGVSLKAATAADLRSLKIQFETNFRRLSSSGAVKLQEMGEPRIEKIAGKFALVIPYTRYTETDHVLWQVEQIKIPFENRLLSLTISYRTSDASAMKPILDRVKRTVAFE